MHNINIFDSRFKENILKNKLIKKAILGDKEAFSKLIKNNKEYLYKTAFIYVKNEEKALEVLQETITRGFMGINNLKNSSYFKTWITRILINVALDMIKKDSNTEELNEFIEYNDVFSQVKIEEKIDLYNAVDLLNDNYKTSIILRYFNDLKIHDIALIMDVPENTVKTYLSRAKKELKGILKTS